MHKFVQHLAEGPVTFDDLTFGDLVATMETLEAADEYGQVEFTVIAHGKVKPDGTD